MAADGWSECPKCGANKGCISECTGLREEYEFHVDVEAKALNVEYYAKCRDCGYEIYYDRQKALTLRPEDAEEPEDYQDLAEKVKELAAEFRATAHHLRFEEASSEWITAAEKLEALLEEEA